MVRNRNSLIYLQWAEKKDNGNQRQIRQKRICTPLAAAKTGIRPDIITNALATSGLTTSVRQ